MINYMWYHSHMGRVGKEKRENGERGRERVDIV